MDCYTQRKQKLEGNALIGDIQQFISQKYPGVVLDSPVQGWWYLDEYKKGIEVYKKIKKPTAEDDRWVGSCHFLLNDDSTASNYFSKAIAHSSQAAHINLAHSYLFTQQAGEVEEELAKVHFDSLQPRDKVQFLRVSSYYRELNSNLKQSLNEVYTAWDIAQTIPENTLLETSLLFQTASCYKGLGSALLAKKHHEKILENGNNDFDRTKIVISFIELLSLLGHYSEAKTAIQTHHLDGISVGMFTSTFYSACGAIAWGEQDFLNATELYNQSVSFAVGNKFIFEEFTARMSLVSLSIAQGSPAIAYKHLVKSKPLVADKYDQLLCRAELHSTRKVSPCLRRHGLHPRAALVQAAHGRY
jgi:tetratricopeptide (TPR) repeat protein